MTVSRLFCNHSTDAAKSSSSTTYASSRTRQMTTLALMLACMLILQWFEHLLPPPLFIPAPVHYGLANIVVMFVVLHFSPSTALIFALLKGFNALLFRGVLASMLSLGGSVLSVVIMLLLSRCSKRISLVVLSISCAIFHNIGQLVVLVITKFYLFNQGIYFLLVPLIFFGCLTGLLSGLILRIVQPFWQQHLKNSIVHWCIILLVLILPTSLVACNSQNIDKQQRDYLEYFDTLTTLVGKNLSSSEFNDYADRLEVELKHFHQLYHSLEEFPGVINPASINNLTVGSEVEIDRDLYDLLQRSFDLQTGVEDKVNVLAGDLLRLWQKHLRNKTVPSEEELAKIKSELPSAEQAFDLDERDGHYWLHKKSAVTLELGAIAKGFAMSKIAERMAEAGAKNLLLSVGGDICPIGPSDVEWSAAIANPLRGSVDLQTHRDLQELVASESDPTAFAKLSEEEWLEIVDVDQCLVTSGVYERYAIADGQLYHHIVDLKSRRPEYRYLSISVAGPDIVICDWLATLLFNCDEETIFNYAEKYSEYSFLILDRQLQRTTYGSGFNQKE